jgi:hypothetical protein
MLSKAEIDKMLEHSAKICSSVDVKESESDETLQDFINRTFCPHTTDGLETRFPNPYNLRNLLYIAGIRAHWTHDLSRHLLIYDDGDDSGCLYFLLSIGTRPLQTFTKVFPAKLENFPF